MQKFDEKMPSFHCTWWTFEIMQKTQSLSMRSVMDFFYKIYMWDV